MTKINVLLADDHKMFLDGMRAVLDADSVIHIVGEALNGIQVLEFLEKGEQQVDVLVLDVEMPEMDGVQVAKEIVKRFPHVKVLIVSMYKRKNYIVNLMRVGVSGYILKNKSKKELVGAIKNVYDNIPHFGLEILGTVSSRDEYDEPETPLTERESEVLCKIAEAMTTKQIAAELNISEATVNTHRRNLLLKLDKPNDKHLVRYAIKIGLVTL